MERPKRNVLCTNLELRGMNAIFNSSPLPLKRLKYKRNFLMCYFYRDRVLSQHCIINRDVTLTILTTMFRIALSPIYIYIILYCFIGTKAAGCLYMGIVLHPTSLGYI